MASNQGSKKKALKETMGINPGIAEPSMKENLQANNNCKFSLSENFDQLKGIIEDMSVLKHDVQGIDERTSVLEGRLSQVEDDVNPMKNENS